MSDPLSSSFASLRFDVFRTAPRTPYSCGVSLLGLLAKILLKMLRASERSSAGVSVRLRNTISVELREDAEEEVKRRFSRLYVAKAVLKELFQLTPEEVIALQDTGSSAAFEVSFFEMSRCLRFTEEWRMKAEEEALRGLRMVPKFQRGYVPVVVRMFNPFVPNYDVELYLARHCAEVKGGTRLLDEEGFWTAKRRFAVKLKEDARVPGGVVDLPAVFYIGPDRGIISYPGQPIFCRRCGGKGHTKAGCKGGGCRFCHATDHTAADCREPKRCSLCGEEGHLYKECEVRSWAGVAAQSVDGSFKEHDGGARNGGQDGGQDGGQTTKPRPHGREEEPRPPLQEELSGAAAEGRTVVCDPPLVDGGRTEAAGEAPDRLGAREVSLAVLGAADPAASGGDGDSLEERAALQTTQDAFVSPEGLSFDSNLVLSPALYSDEEMPDLGPSAKRALPVEEYSEGSARKEFRTGGEVTSSDGEAGTSSSGGVGASADSGEESLRVAEVATVLVASEEVTEEQRKAVSDWSLSGSSSAGSQESGSPVVLAGGQRGSGSVSPSVESPASSGSDFVSPVFGADVTSRPGGTSRGASLIPVPARRGGESGAPGGTVGFGRGDSRGSGQGGLVRSAKGRERGSLRK